MKMIHKLSAKIAHLKTMFKHRKKSILAPLNIKYEHGCYQEKKVSPIFLNIIVFTGYFNPYFIPLLNHSYNNGFFPWAVSLEFLSMCSLVNLIKSKNISYNAWFVTLRQKRLQRFIDREGVNTLPHILALFYCGIYEAGNPPLMDQLVYNLKLLLPKVDEEAILLINHDHRKLLQALVSQHPHTGSINQIPSSGRLAFYGRPLTSELIPLLGRIGELESMDSLTSRFQRSYAPRIHKLINQFLHEIYPDAVMKCQDTLGSSEYRRKVLELRKSLGDNSRSRALGVYTRRLLHYGSLSVSILLIILIFNNERNVELMRNLILMLTATTVVNLVPKIRESKRKEKIRKLTNFCIGTDSPDALVSLLGEDQFLRFNSRIADTLMITELLQNITAENVPVLNSFQIEQVNRLLFPENLFRSSTRFLNGPMENIIDLEKVILSLRFIGNASSIRALDRFISKSKNEYLRESAENTIASIKSRLAENPADLLRPSVGRNDDLLRTTTEALDSFKLLHTINNVTECSSVTVETSALETISLTQND